MELPFLAGKEFAGNEVEDTEAFITGCLKGQPADYVEVRLEDTESTRLSLRGSSIESARQNVLAGGCVRALVSGGWGFVSFTDPEELPGKIAEAISLATCAALGRGERRAVRGSSGGLAPCPAARADVDVPVVRKDPRTVSLDHKVQLLLDYAALAVSSGPPVRSVQAFYQDRFTRLTFANSEGSYVVQRVLDVSGSVRVMAGRGSETQYQVCQFGSSGDYAVVEGREPDIRAACDVAVRLLDAPQGQGGEQTVILDPTLTGTFIHEAFGHLSEADNLTRNPELAEKMSLGRVLGPSLLNVYDTGRLTGVRGHLVYDDEGVRAEPIDLVREGRLVGRLHSRETAGVLGERPTGNARAVSYRYHPIPRMRTTCIAPGEMTPEDLLRGVSRGLYARRASGGSRSDESFVLYPGEAYLIRDGRLGPLVRDVVISGNVFETLSLVDGVSNDFGVFDGPGGCGKLGQNGLAVSSGGPSLRVRRLLVGGSRP